MDRTVSVTVSDVVRALDIEFPFSRAESWDRNGLLAGDPNAPVLRVMLALDASVATVQEAARIGAQVLVTHHPAFLEPPSVLAPGPGAAGVLFEALSAGVALVNVHTPLDRDRRAQILCPTALGLDATGPLEVATATTSRVTVFVPEAYREQVVAAATAAGAGRVGAYEECSFFVLGEGSFTAPASASPALGRPGEHSVAEESRIEMVTDPSRVSAVVRAISSVHPYEEPLIVVDSVGVARNASAFGMLSSAPADETLASLAARAATVVGSMPRVWGSPDLVVRSVATATGSAGSLVGAARAAGADVLVAGEVRYHDAVDAVESGLAIIELGHDVSEWPLVDLLTDAIGRHTGIGSGSVTRMPTRIPWWTPQKETDR